MTIYQLSNLTARPEFHIDNNQIFKLHSNLKYFIEGYENQEAEIIGEGALTIAYKTMQGSDRSSPMVFKVFKVRLFLYNKFINNHYAIII